MSQKLEIVREQKLFRLLPSRKEDCRLEASGVALQNDTTALVIFDNLNLVARIDLSLKRRNTNQLFPAPSLALGFEDIAIDRQHGRFLCLIESLEDVDGHLRSFVAEYDPDGRFLRCNRLETRFKNANKGFEGLTHAWLKGREYLYALHEDNFGPSAQASGGRVEVFTRHQDETWQASHQLHLPQQAEFEDYAALDYREGQLAVVSQESARLWVARLDKQSHAVVPGSDAIYRFPSKSYGNIEGIAWLSTDTLVAVSDRKKRNQPDRCAEKDQSIHIFRIPSA